MVKQFISFCNFRVEMLKISIRTTLIVLLTTFATGQLRSNLPSNSLPVNSYGISHARGSSLFDLNRLSISNSFGMSMSSFGNQSISIGSFNTNINYFGVSRPDESDDVLSIKVPVIKLLNEIEQFTIEFENDSIFNYISLKWDLTKVMIPFK